MSRFYGSLDPMSSRKPATKCGHSGLKGHIRGWNVGVIAEAKVDDDGEDAIEVWTTYGSTGKRLCNFLGKVKMVSGTPTLIPHETE